ncbi:unnamed protein product [Linum trigynum]|uniref:Secreted protein n=1 Tax=Linum trigynum TaxID=586398 RepID=A0AAV2EUR0_9ROSI
MLVSSFQSPVLLLLKLLQMLISLAVVIPGGQRQVGVSGLDNHLCHGDIGNRIKYQSHRLRLSIGRCQKLAQNSCGCDEFFLN